MGAGYTAAPVVFGASVLPWPYRTAVTSGSRYFYGNNVYLCTTSGVAGSVPPTSVAPATFADSTSTLLYIGTLGTLGNPYITGTFVIGTQYYYDNRLYVAIATAASGTTPPTHTSGIVGSLLYM